MVAQHVNVFPKQSTFAFEYKNQLWISMYTSFHSLVFMDSVIFLLVT